jgi:hypothetical protein
MNYLQITKLLYNYCENILKPFCKEKNSGRLIHDFIQLSSKIICSKVKEEFGYEIPYWNLWYDGGTKELEEYIKNKKEKLEKNKERRIKWENSQRKLREETRE